MHASDFEEVEFPPRLSKQYNTEKPNDLSLLSHGKELTRPEFKSLLDSDGRLVDEHRLRKSVFRGGVNPVIRKDVWQFLFGLYPCISTASERETRLVEYYAKYRALKKKWQNILASNAEDAKLVTPPYLKNDGEVSPDKEQLPQLTELERQTSQAEVEAMLGRPLSPEVSSTLSFVHFEAELYAGRQKIDLAVLKSAIRIIDKDVPRTDRELEYFKGTNNPNLRILRDILITYAAYHSEVNYAQGMNDILSRFLRTFKNEVEAYWCFVQYLEQFKSDFLEEGVLDKMKFVGSLLKEIDPDLYSYLDHLGMSDMTFCHRWMLLSFKRELCAEDSLKCFEIISSHHLELSSNVAEGIRQEEQRKYFQKQEGRNRTAAVDGNKNFTFDVFMCVAILVQNRHLFFDCEEVTDIFQLTAKLSAEMNLDSLLNGAERLFCQYCTHSVTNCFLVVDLPSPDS